MNRFLFAFVLPVFAVSMTAMAQTAPSPPGHDAQGSMYSTTGWQVVCTNTGKELACQSIQRVTVAGDSQQPVVTVAVELAAGTRTPTVAVQVPLGFLLTAPLTLRVDDQPSLSVPVQTCLKDGCSGSVALPEAMVAAARGGKQLSLSYTTLNNGNMVFALPLEGFALAYDKVI